MIAPPKGLDEEEMLYLTELEIKQKRKEMEKQNQHLTDVQSFGML